MRPDTRRLRQEGGAQSLPQLDPNGKAELMNPYIMLTTTRSATDKGCHDVGTRAVSGPVTFRGCLRCIFMSSVYLISPAGHPNYGDELIAAGWLRHLSQTHPEHDVWLDCPNPGLASVLFSALHPRLRVTNTLWRASWEAGSDDPAVVTNRVLDVVRNFGTPAYDLGLERLYEVESFHLLGGGYINRLWPKNAGLVAGAAAVGSLTGARLYATGLSVVPLLQAPTAMQDSGSSVIELLRGFDHVSVRDEPSAALLGLELGLDDAFLAAEYELRKGLERGGADMVVCLQSDLQSEEQRRQVAAGARELISDALAQGKTVQYIEAIPGVDRAGFDALRDLIRVEDFIPFASIWREGLPLRADQTWLTTRFHLHFMAAAAGATGKAINIRDGYYNIKHRSLIELGTGWSHVDAARTTSDTAPAPDANALSFSSMLNARSTQKSCEAFNLYPCQNDAVAHTQGPPPVSRQKPSARPPRGLLTALSHMFR